MHQHQFDGYIFSHRTYTLFELGIYDSVESKKMEKLQHTNAPRFFFFLTSAERLNASFTDLRMLNGQLEVKPVHSLAWETRERRTGGQKNGGETLFYRGDEGRTCAR